MTTKTPGGWDKLTPGLPVEVLWDGKVFETVENADAAFTLLHNCQNFSVDYACRYGGYSVRNPAQVT